MTELGKLREVPLREIWNHEQYDFSDWLAQESNLNELGEILGLTLTDVETEKFVGSYRCDIVCKDETSGQIVLIENQLEPSNHDHLGKIITYASGLKASVIVWIVEEAREEHASAIEWLNENIDPSISFFLIEIHAMKIGDSKPAPQFKIIEQPNDFNVQTKKVGNSDKDNAREANRLDFWTQFNEVLIERGLPFNKRKPTKDHWYDFAISSSKCHLCLELINKDGYLRVGMWIPHCKEQYDEFLEHKEEIEKVVGCQLLWDNIEGKKGARISMKLEGLNFDDHSNYPQLMNDGLDMLIKFKKAFKPFLI